MGPKLTVINDWVKVFVNRFTKRSMGQVQLTGCKWTSELDFHIWNANWPMKCEAKMAAHGGQFCTSVPVPYAGLYVSFSLPRDFLHFLKISLWKYTQDMSLCIFSSTLSGPYLTLVFYSGQRQTILLIQRRPLGQERVKNFKYVSTKSNRVTDYSFSRKYITKLTRNLIKRSRKITWGNY